MSLIELKNITKSYPVGDSELKILKGIDLQIEEGDFVAIMGPSGSGKSTCMNILGCLDVPTSGSYKLDGKAVEGIVGGELAFADALNQTIDENPEKMKIQTLSIKPTDMYLDCGSIEGYEKALLYTLLTESKFKGENIKFSPSFIKQI